MTRKYTAAKQGAAAMTQQAVADKCGISVTRVQQIEKRAMQKIRKSIERRAKRAKVTVWEWLFGDAEVA